MQPVDGSILQVLGGLSGEPLTVHLMSQEAKKIESVRDLTRCLTRNVTRPLGRTPGTPFSVHWIRLIHTDASMASMELHDEDPVNPETWEWLEQGSLRYMRADVFSFPPEALPSGDDLKFSYENLEELLDPKLLIGYAFKLCKHGGQAWCENVFTLWTSALLSLSSNQVNAVENILGHTLLNRCFSLLQGLDEAEELMRAADPDCDNRNWPDSYEDFYDKQWPDDAFEDFLHKTFASMTIELVRQKADPQRVKEIFRNMFTEKVKSIVWKLVQGQSCGCNRRSCTRGALRFGLGADLLMALIDKGLPRCCWAGHWGPFNDNLLQHIIAPVAAKPVDWNPRDGAKARLCRFLAKRFSLEELCYQNRDFKNALWYVLQYCENSPFQADPLWVRVRDVIRERMQRQVREFQGSLLALVDLARSVRASFGGGIDALEALPAFEEQMWQRAAIIREEWLRMGWTFAQDSANGQVSEVLDWHFRAVGQGIVC